MQYAATSKKFNKISKTRLKLVVCFKESVFEQVFAKIDEL